jgi:hypothetical protein
LKIHPVVHVIHTTPYRSQPPDIAVPLPEKPAPVPTYLERRIGLKQYWLIVDEVEVISF